MSITLSFWLHGRIQALRSIGVCIVSFMFFQQVQPLYNDVCPPTFMRREGWSAPSSARNRSIGLWPCSLVGSLQKSRTGPWYAHAYASLRILHAWLSMAANAASTRLPTSSSSWAAEVPILAELYSWLMTGATWRRSIWWTGGDRVCMLMYHKLNRM